MRVIEVGPDSERTGGALNRAVGEALQSCSLRQVLRFFQRTCKGLSLSKCGCTGCWKHAHPLDRAYERWAHIKQLGDCCCDALLCALCASVAWHNAGIRLPDELHICGHGQWGACALLRRDLKA